MAQRQNTLTFKPVVKELLSKFFSIIGGVQRGILRVFIKEKIGKIEKKKVNMMRVTNKVLLLRPFYTHGLKIPVGEKKQEQN